MRILIFDNMLSGHHLEYLNLIYNGAAQNKDNTYIFAVPKQEWDIKRDLCLWPQCDNIKWIMLDDIRCAESNKGGLIAACYKQSKLVKEVSVRENIDSIIMISLAGVIPLLPFMLPSKVKLSGIIYKIYLRRKITKIRSIIEKFRYCVMAKSSVVKNIYILNDPKSTYYFNQKYNTDKFVALADPVPRRTNVVSLRKKYNVAENELVFLHFGSMDLRKGTLDILKAIKILPKDKLEGKVFIFAGKISSSISERFYSLVNDLKKINVRLIVEDGFCEYNHLNDLCYTCDCILIPYLFTDLSSGALGYAAIYNKPVIAPSTGLIGELVKNNDLGVRIDEITPDKLSKAIETFRRYAIKANYAEKNSSKAFINTILS